MYFVNYIVCPNMYTYFNKHIFLLLVLTCLRNTRNHINKSFFTDIDIWIDIYISYENVPIKCKLIKERDRIEIRTNFTRRTEG